MKVENEVGMQQDPNYVGCGMAFKFTDTERTSLGDHLELKRDMVSFASVRQRRGSESEAGGPVRSSGSNERDT